MQITKRNPYTEPVTSVEELEYDKLYPITHLARIVIGRGRYLDEALRNDPLAPAPIENLKQTRSKLFSRKQVEDYLSNYVEMSDVEKYVEQAIKNRVDPERDRLAREREKLRAERGRIEKDSVHEARREAREVIYKELARGRFVKIKDMSLRFCGVYFLFKKGVLQYVGQSVNIFARIATHTKSKEFDEVRVFYCAQEELNDYEGMFIRLLQPPLNGKTGTPVSRFSASLERIGPEFLDPESVSETEDTHAHLDR